MKHTLLLLSLLFAPALGAQSLTLRPLAIPPGDTTDHVDVAYKGKAAADAQAVVVAVVFDAANRLQTGQRVTWTSADPSIATVSGSTANAVVTARGYGATTLTATVGSLKQTLTVCAYGASYPGTVAVVGPTAVRLGSKLAYQATTTSGALFPAECVHWSTSNASASVDRRGVVTGKAISGAQINVTAFLGVP